MRETFVRRNILIPFDTNFNMEDESVMGNRDAGKNISDLTHFVDSVKYTTDSLNRQSVPYFKNRVYASAFKHNYTSLSQNKQAKDTLFAHGFQAFFDSLSIDKQLIYINKAKSKADNINSEYTFSASSQTNTNKTVKSHQIQIQKRFALSLACLLFFFIGAPLGAIIRKGGIGMPAVISVVLFIFYYTIDTFGLKLAKQDVWPVWEGMWLSTVVLAVLGIFFTYKAVNDWVIPDFDVWKSSKIVRWLTRFFQIKQ
jgi:lipopolysaccharide export system permease protein